MAQLQNELLRVEDACRAWQVRLLDLHALGSLFGLTRNIDKSSYGYEPGF